MEIRRNAHSVSYLVKRRQTSCNRSRRTDDEERLSGPPCFSSPRHTKEEQEPPRRKQNLCPLDHYTFLRAPEAHVSPCRKRVFYLSGLLFSPLKWRTGCEALVGHASRGGALRRTLTLPAVVGEKKEKRAGLARRRSGGILFPAVAEGFAVR